METAKVFFGGIPSAADVKKLVDHFGKPEPGLIPYAEIAEVLDLEWRTSRFKLIVTNWRKSLIRECNIDTIAEPGMGIRVLKVGERLDVTHKDLKTAIRKGRRAFIRLNSIPVAECNELERRKYDHQMRHTQAIVIASTTHAKELTASLKREMILPRIGPGMTTGKASS